MFDEMNLNEIKIIELRKKKMTFSEQFIVSANSIITL